MEQCHLVSHSTDKLIFKQRTLIECSVSYELVASDGNRESEDDGVQKLIRR